LADLGGRLSRRGLRTAGRLRGGVLMRVMFVTYLVLVVVGLAYFIAIGLLQN
jgi:hypothetical protein